MEGEVENQVIESFKDRLSPSYYKFAQRVYSPPSSTYERRIQAIGFVNQKRVLDAGCGFGQWALALSRHNERVDAIDKSAVRIAFLRKMIKAKNLRNIVPATGSIEHLPYKKETFDSVFAYGAVCLTRWRETLKELLRVLKKGGLLYVNAQGMGWYFHLWAAETNRAPDYDPREWVAKAFMNTVLYRNGKKMFAFGGLIIERDELFAELKKNGCEVLHEGGEGTISIPGVTDTLPPVQSFFRGEYEGRTGIYEMLAKKKKR
jgi:ubiquinone/menaquinone biosynthesis C-methylase UbiE